MVSVAKVSVSRVSFSKKMLVLAAALSAAITGLDIAGGSASASDKDGSRWTDAFGTPGPVATPVAGGKADRLVPSVAACSGQSWPYIAAGCLNTDQAATRPTARIVTVERPSGPQASELSREPVPQFAIR